MRNNIIFKRKIYNKLLDWKNSSIHNSALLIEGARRIGKSTIVEEFAKNEFKDNYIIVDFRKESDEVKNLFNDVKNLDSFFQNFFLLQNRVLNEGGLIVFDEVQFCPKAREAIKDFVSDGRYFFIETGSLISIKDNVENIMIPSEEKRINMYPMDFEEFLWATENNNSFSLFADIFKRHDNIPQAIHEEYMRKFRTYIIIGGMPKVLSTFLQTNSFFLAEEEKLDIIKLYKDDLRKHDIKHNTSCELLFDSIPTQLAKANRRFVVNKSGNLKRFELQRKSLSDLIEYKIVNKVEHINTLDSPISLYAEESKFKLYFCDTGLLMTMLVKANKEKVNEAYFKFITGKKVLNMGSIYESIAIQQLVLNDLPTYYHKYNLYDKDQHKEKQYELDLVTEFNFKTYAIEIKSSKTYTTSSLDHIKEKYSQLKINKYVFGIKNIKFENNKTTLPIYLLLFLPFLIK